MKFSRLTLLVDPVPIENAVSGVAILLDLDQEVSGANGVKPSRRHKHGSTALHSDLVNTIGNGSGMKGLLELIALHRFPETDQNLGIRFHRRDVPKFALGVAA